MQSHQPTGERQAPHSPTHPTQTDTFQSQTNHPSLPSPSPPRSPTTPSTSTNKATPPSPLFTTQNQVVFPPRPRTNMFAQNKPYDPNYPPSTPERGLSAIQVNSKALSEGHKATQQTLRNEADGIQQVNIPGVGKRLVRRSNPPSPLSTPTAGAGAIVPMTVGLMTPSPARVRNTVFSPFKIPSSNLSPKSSLEAIKESDEQPTQKNPTEEDKSMREEKVLKEEKGRNATAKAERVAEEEVEALRGVIAQLDEEDRRAELEHRHSPPSSNLSRDGIDQKQNDRSEVGQHTSDPNINYQYDDRVPVPGRVPLNQFQYQPHPRRGDQSIPRDVRNLRAEQHRYHSQTHSQNQNQNQNQDQGHHDTRHHSMIPGSSAAAHSPGRSNGHPSHQSEGPHTGHSGQGQGVEPKKAQDPHEQQWDDRRPDSQSRARGSSGPQRHEQGHARPQPHPGHPVHQAHQEQYLNQNRPNPRQVMAKDNRAHKPHHHHQQQQQQFQYQQQGHPQDRYGPVFAEGEDDQDPFIDHSSSPRPSRKRFRPQNPHEESDIGYEHEHGTEIEAESHAQDQNQVINYQDPKDQDQGRPPKRVREQSTQTEEPTSEPEAEEGSEAEFQFDPTAPVEPYDYIGQIQEPWKEAMAQHVPYLDEWAERFISTSIDYVLAVYKCSHKSSIKLGESLQEGVDEILSQQDWQNARRQTFIDFRKQMAKVAQALGDIDPEEEEVHVSSPIPKKRV